ncbi:MAG: hypothetical protein NZ556_01415 [Fimbriimonadales bacterium]|nr:hypothetical protein [Fimbriimonadales bacterium]
MARRPSVQREYQRQLMLRWITTITQWMISVGAILFTLGLIYLLYAVLFAGLDSQQFTPQDQARIRDNLALAGNALLLGAGCIVIGLAWNYLEEPMVGVVLLLLAVVFYWGVPFLIGQFGVLPAPETLRDFALTRIRNTAWVLFPPGLVLTVFVSLAHAIKRLRYGSSLDQTLRLGTEVSQQQVQRRFLGKCWQLPYCRDYVRERCPIYHARRTCWREGVGCMCEEKTIAMALKDVRLSDDPEKNAKYIPHNTTLSKWELKQRCNECVIYNEHQRQKYQLFAPLTVGTVLGIAYFFREPLQAQVLNLLGLLDSLLARFTLMPSEAREGVLKAAAQTSEIASLVLYIAAVIVVLSYSLRLVETVIFKWKW